MCALAHVSTPSPYQMWELSLLAQARQEAEWDKIAQLSYYILRPWVKGHLDMASLNPVRRAKSSQERASFGKIAATLTSEEQLSKDEIERRWQELQERWQTQEQ